jgi:hypothetical protein
MVTFVFLSLDWINTKVTRLTSQERNKNTKPKKEREQKSKINKKKLKT